MTHRVLDPDRPDSPPSFVQLVGEYGLPEERFQR
jgi:hypothetical protein